MIDQIEKHFRKCYPSEGCGIIGIRKGKKEWFPCTNLAKEDEDFIIGPEEYLKIRKIADVYAIVHSHPDSSNVPSENDIKFCNVMGVRYWIFDYPGMNLYELEPTTYTNELIGREYEFGVKDCYEAVRDHYKKYLNITLERGFFIDDWWEYGYNYFTDEYIRQVGFYPVSNPQNHDLLVFTMGSKVPNHCGVYLGDNIMYHHAVNRLSCRENIYPMWKKYLTGIYRYGKP